MNNYLLSIDPSIKNTGFTLWDVKWCHNGCGKKICNHHTPIWIKSYSFNKFTIKSSLDLKWEIRGVIIPDINTKSDNTYPWLEKFDLIIERGTFHSKNGIGYETQEHLRGFIAGQFNKLLTKDMLISPSSWKKWYISNLKNNFNLPKKQEFIWIKNTSIQLANELIKQNNWNITISNHDEADSLLIGWYYLNKEK